MRRIWCIILIVLVLGVGALLYLRTLPPRPTSSVKEVLNQAGTLHNKVVVVRGRVRMVVGADGGGVFWVGDDSGACVPVKTSRDLPPVDATVTVRGRLWHHIRVYKWTAATIEAGQVWTDR